jgi:LEA14-like dessication related protein
MQLLQMTNIKNPHVSVTDTKISGLSFTQADLLMDIKIDNPNNVGIDLAGMNFDLKINNQSLLSSFKNDPLQIGANGTNTIQLPLTLKYEDIYRIITSLGAKEQSDYQFEGNVNFNLPVLGAVSIPVSKSGRLPLIKMPQIKVKKINLKSFAWSSAQLEMDIVVAGGGGLPLLIDNLNYGLKVGGALWVDGALKEPIAVSGTGEKIISIPFKLDFLTMGKSVYDIVAGNAGFDYSFLGDMNISADNPLLKAVKLSFSDLNKIALTR